MSPIAMEVLERLADVSVRALLLAAIAWPATRLIRTAAARHGIWCALLAGMLAMPILAPLLPPIRSAVVTRYAPPFAGFDVSVPKVSPARSSSRTAPITLPPQPQQQRWATPLACLYLAMVLALLTRFLLAYRFSRSLVRKSSPIRDEHPLNLMEDLSGAKSMPWPLPQLRASPDVVVPVTIGWRDPVILLPDGWQNWDAWKLNAVLAHELAHIRRADWLVTVAASLNRCLFWFHPLAWWLERHLSALSEQACDEAALHTVSDAARYARAVLEFASALQSGSRLAYGVAMARTTKVSHRIDRILAIRKPGPGIMKKSTWTAVFACALPLVYSAAALQVTQAPSQPSVHPGIAQLLTEGSKLSATEAQQIEEQLARDPEDLAVRGKLIAYYQWNAMDASRLRHVHWLIQNHPEAEMTIFFSHAYLVSAAEYETDKKLWMEQVSLHPIDARVLASAAQLIGEKEPLEGKDLLERARQADPSNPEWLKRLADLMSRAIQFSLTGEPVYSVGPGGEKTPVDTSFGIAARADLESSSDATLVGTVGEFLSGGLPGGNPAPRAQIEFAEHLLTRAQSLEPNNAEWSGALNRLRAQQEPLPATSGKRIRVVSQVQQSNLLQSVDPVYPPLAKQAHIQGVVRFSVTIGKDGHVSNIRLISGHPLFVEAAREAVRQWVYRPTLLNGDPVEVTAEVDVPFTLDQSVEGK